MGFHEIIHFKGRIRLENIHFDSRHHWRYPICWISQALPTGQLLVKTLPQSFGPTGLSTAGHGDPKSYCVQK